MTVVPFVLHLARPTGDWLPAIEARLRASVGAPLRWAVVAVDGDTLVIEGASLCSRPSS